MPISSIIKIKTTQQEPIIREIYNNNIVAIARVSNSDTKKLKENQKVKLRSFDETLIARVSFVHNYASYQELLEKEGWERLFPFFGSFQQSLDYLNNSNFANKVEKSGCVAIGIKPEKLWLNVKGVWQEVK